MISNEQFYHLNQVTNQTDIDDNEDCSPSHQEYGGPILIPNTAHFSDNVLYQVIYTQYQDKYEQEMVVEQQESKSVWVILGDFGWVGWNLFNYEFLAKTLYYLYQYIQYYGTVAIDETNAPYLAYLIVVLYVTSMSK